MFQKLFILGCLIVSQNGWANEDSNSQTDNWVHIDSSGYQLAGNFTIPKNADTAILIIAGSGATDHNGNNEAAGLMTNSYKMLAEELNAAGYAVLRVDKRGLGKSAQPNFDMSNTTFQHHVDDVSAWINYLKGKDFRTVVIGHSLGGLMAMMAAQDNQIDRLILLNSVADIIYQSMKRQMADQPEFVNEAAIPLLDRLAKGETIPAEEVPEFLNPLFSPTIQPYLKSFLLINPKSELSKLTQPSLAIIGDTDLQVTVEETQKLTEGQSQVTLKVIEGMNHIFKEAPTDREANIATYYQGDLPLHSQLIPIILEFLNDKIPAEE